MSTQISCGISVRYRPGRKSTPACSRCTKQRSVVNSSLQCSHSCRPNRSIDSLTHFIKGQAFIQSQELLDPLAYLIIHLNSCS